MQDFFKDIFKNQFLVITFTSWFFAQCLKVALGIARERKFDFRWFLGTGGMPSTHAAGVAALATSCGLAMGFDSLIFAIAAVFAMVTMFDAQGVRRETGQQAEILNKILDDIYWKGKVEGDKLKELVGHTPVQVFAGALLGIFIALIMYFVVL